MSSRIANAGGVTDVVGYRVLRSAASGGRSRLLLGFADDETVVLKITSAGDPRTPIEIEALARAAGEHVVALRDVGRDEHDAVLVLDRLGNGTLAELLDRRAGLDAGEAVTILAPLATTLNRLHAAGVAHGRLGLDSVCFADDGAPTLVGFGAAELFAAGSPEVVLEGIPGVLADRAALRSLTGLVLTRVVGAVAAGAGAAGAGLDAVRRLTASLEGIAPDRLAAALFDLAAAAPVRFVDEEADASQPRVVGVQEADVVEPEVVPALPAWLVAFIPDPLRERLEQPAARIREIWTTWDARRRRLALGGLAAAATVVVALGVVPSAPAPVDAAPADAAVETAVPVPVDEPTLPDDPLEAAELLLALRDQCVRDLSLLCLDAVVQPGSSAQSDDLALIRDIENGGEYAVAGRLEGDLVLVERLGDSALVDLPVGSDPSSILLMRTADGWRIRDYLPAVPLVGQGDAN